MTIQLSDFKLHTPDWCPGCGDFGIWGALKNALVRLQTAPDNVLVVYGIGCHGHLSHFLKSYGFEGLHGRALPVAEGVKLANHKLKVIVSTGDGDCLGEGLSHFIHTIRGNHDITCFIHDNQVYGLTTGQTSPTSPKGYKTKTTPEGVIEDPVNPLTIALAAGATFVARGYAGNMPHLTELMIRALEHKGFAVVDILQPCITFNKVNTYEWFQQHTTVLESTYNPNNRVEAFQRAQATGPLPLGVFYQETKPTFNECLPQLADRPLVYRQIDSIRLDPFLKEFQ